MIKAWLEGFGYSVHIFYYEFGFSFLRHYICIKNSGIGRLRQQDSKITDTDVNADEGSLIWSTEGHAESLYG